jgi:hypothetical protein
MYESISSSLQTNSYLNARGHPQMDETTHDNHPRTEDAPSSGGMAYLYCHSLTEEPNAVLLTTEAYRSSRSIQRSLQARIAAIVHQLSSNPEPLGDTENTDIDYVVAEPFLSDSLFDYLIDYNRLPESDGEKRIVYELVANQLVVGIRPGMCHDFAVGSFIEDLLRWAASGDVTESLRIGMGACTRHRLI